MPSAVRIAEIDCIRGIAIVLMVLFHLIFDLAYFYNWPINYLDGFWYYQGKSSAVLFMLVSGISTTLTSRHVRRGLTVLGAGLVITAATFVFSPAEYIRFGILHLLGTGMLLAPWLTERSAKLLLAAGTIIIILGQQAASLTTSVSYLIPLGLTPPDFSSLDYYPLLPWLGVILYGMAAGKLLYPHKQPLYPSIATNALARSSARLGRQSLPIYLLHQPVLLGVLYLIL